ncbi:MAG: hypothetical protein ACLPH3_17760 [Terracidiphilus sp.]
MRWKWIAVSAIIGSIALITVTVLVVRARRWNSTLMTLQGAVIRRDKDTQKEVPISDVQITATRGTRVISTRSDASGYFKIKFPEVIWPGQTVALSFRRDGYQPLDIDLHIQFRSMMRRLYIAAMEPEPSTTQTGGSPGKSISVVSNVRVRYTENFQTDEEIGGAERTFQVVNRGNIPCRREAPCSPDGSWKATRASVTLDAGAGNEFRNVRASCIAGPCPFTRIDPSGFQQPGRTIEVAAIDWSDTATFLLEAEVVHTTIASSVRHSYPVIFDRTFNFTVPPTQEGVSLEAEVNGAPMVFPMGPDLYLSWANCTATTSTDSENSTAYRCELKPGYRF